MPTVSYEFFPPRNESQSRRFWRTLGCLELLSPAWASITYGALESGCDVSFETIELLHKDCATPVAAHLTCGGRSATELHASVDRFAALGVRHIVALRGDQGTTETAADGQAALRHAEQLVELLAERGGFDISVAAYPEVHPEARSEADDLACLVRKLDAGASRAITQFFFDADLFLRWRDRAIAAGVNKPIVAGILPIHDIDKVVGFSARCGTRVPKALVSRFDGVTDSAQRDAIAVEQCLELCYQLSNEGVDDFHLYTMNQSRLVRPVTEALTGGGPSAERNAA